MKFCSRPWDFLYMYSAEGNIQACSWFKGNMDSGNILNQELEEIMEGKVLNKIKKTILDGSFRYCDSQLCTFLSNDSLPDLTEEEIKKKIQNNIPDVFNISYDNTCNHACPSCRKGHLINDAKLNDNIEEISKKMLPYFNKAKYININGRGEIFASKHLLDLLYNLKPERSDFTLNIETNAALFNEKNWKKIEHLSDYRVEVIATVQSFVDSTYRDLSGYVNHVDQLIACLHFMRELRQTEKINKITISMIVQESNFRELPEYIKRCFDEFKVDEVRIRGILQFGMSDEEYWIKDVFNPRHPFHREAMEVLHHPVMKDPRIWYWEGDYENGRRPVNGPVQKFKSYYDFLYRLEMCADINKLYDNWRQRLLGKRVGIYGAGKIKNVLEKRFADAEIEIDEVFDKNVYLGFKELSSDSLSRVDVIIITPMNEIMKIRENLENMGFVGEIISVDDLI